MLEGIADCQNVAQVNSELPAKLAQQLTFGTNHAGGESKFG
jgi:hypothetical protein